MIRRELKYSYDIYDMHGNNYGKKLEFSLFPYHACIYEYTSG